jgi:hypothetical protein
LQRLKEKAARLKEEAGEVERGVYEDADHDKELAVYMINQMKKEMPKKGKISIFLKTANSEIKGVDYPTTGSNKNSPSFYGKIPSEVIFFECRNQKT